MPRCITKAEIIDVYDLTYDKTASVPNNGNYSYLCVASDGEMRASAEDAAERLSENKLVLIPSRLEAELDLGQIFDIVIKLYGDCGCSKITVFDCGSRMSADKMRLILDNWKKLSDHGYYMAHAYLYEIFAEISSKLDKKRDKISLGHDMIELKYRDPELTVGIIAKELHVSPAYFRREFGKKYGVSPKKKITALRLEYSKLLLEDGNVTVMDAASQSGFYDSNYFATVFKRHYGVSPSEYPEGDL